MTIKDRITSVLTAKLSKFDALVTEVSESGEGDFAVRLHLEVTRTPKAATTLNQMAARIIATLREGSEADQWMTLAQCRKDSSFVEDIAGGSVSLALVADFKVNMQPQEQEVNNDPNE